ncbi:FecCD family ABC transporter permease [Paenibacillus turpanensis]|uniref:FecCD family ABC transporter permease n=1 Tax=Paenibacillus turpanensis TaxID=2689078 RepID=UPI001407F886|nr:iron ABC transporter permease [Paenibacillus turpanensis]
MLAKASSKVWGMGAAVLILAGFMVCSVLFGVYQTSLEEVFGAFTQFNGSNSHIVIQEVRVPRAIIASFVGACLGVSGVYMQTLTRNPLADAGILGVNSGAALFIVVAFVFFGVGSVSQFIWIAFAGAALSSIAVYTLGSVGRSGLTPMTLTLAGAAFSAFATSLTHGILTLDERANDEILFWIAGSIAGRKLDILIAVLPYMSAALLLSLFYAPALNVLSLGEDVAKGLGQRTVLIKAVAGLIVVLLAGGSVAAAGPIAFIGLIVPHIAKYFAGTDLRWAVPYSAFVGAIILVAADTASRFIAFPKEMPISVMTAIIGAPFFIYTARKGVWK